MRPLAALALLAAGCSAHYDPRADATLFDSAEARARRDLFALYYTDDPDLGTGSILIRRGGTAEAHFEPGPRMNQLYQAAQKSMGLPDPHRHETGIPVTAARKEEMERLFAMFPPRESSWSLVEEPPMEYPPRGRSSSSPVRMLHVSPSGEVKILVVHKGAPPAGARPGGADLAALERLFIEMARRR